MLSRGTYADDQLNQFALLCAECGLRAGQRGALRAACGQAWRATVAARAAAAGVCRC